MAEYFRGNLWPNTPDILHETLQRGGRPAFRLRLVLAATLSSLYGIYSGYELCENEPFAPGSEEYLHSEKYELKMRDWNAPGNLVGFITRVNRIRREHRALQLYRNLDVLRRRRPAHPLVRQDDRRRATTWCSWPSTSTSLATHAAMVDVPLDDLGIAPDQPVPDARAAQRRRLRVAGAARLRRAGPVPGTRPRSSFSAAVRR